MWNQKKKAVTFSFDDGVLQDIRVIEILNKYGLKGTFNINSGYLGRPNQLNRNGRDVDHTKVSADDLKKCYQGHEIAVHTITHPNLVELDEEEIIWQVENDRRALSYLCGYEVVGMAYPFGMTDERVVQIMKEHTKVQYARTVESTHRFDLQTEDLLTYNPTVYFIEDCFEQIVDAFLESESDDLQLLYIWGHAYELDAAYITWEKFERICKKLAGRPDIFYGTNNEVLLQRDGIG